ncbi:MAG: 6-carboxytetrahydropterin synthase [Thiohalocapsa sp.]|nr:6-carboxytetrahydropterin synthase [Thiohalocapsa sp.]MCF7992050.1 6-carboxytetrahydropterin synthase [Thiohalocapsa sp.]
MSELAVRVHPGELHFNAAHFITFDGTCENLHGHNFHVELEARGDAARDAFVIDFVLLNRLAAEICRTLHDGVLLPGQSDEVSIREQDGMVAVESYGKRFLLPKESAIILPMPNTTAEMLAMHIGDRLVEALGRHDALAGLSSLQVAVEEADRQWGIHRRRFDGRG